jgi:hypothetical protein
MLVTMIIIAALLAGAAALVSLQLSSTRSSGLTQSSISALYCAEAGLSAARPVVADNYGGWAAAFAAPGVEPAWLAGVDHDVDGDTFADFVITIHDNDDEQSPLTNDLSRDNDLQVFVVSQCIKYGDTPAAVSELIHLSSPGKCYQAQEGGCGGNGNSN